MDLAIWKRHGFPGQVVFDDNFANEPNILVLLVKTSELELDNVKREFNKRDNYKKITGRGIDKIKIIDVKPGYNDPVLHTLIIIIQFDPNSRGGNTRKNNTRKNNTRKNYKKK